MHVPQTPEARAEAMAIMAVPRNIVSPQANKPVIGIVQVRRGFWGRRSEKKKRIRRSRLTKNQNSNSPSLSLFSLSPTISPPFPTNQPKPGHPPRLPPHDRTRLLHREGPGVQHDDVARGLGRPSPDACPAEAPPSLDRQAVH
jgi:hypothetical protein